MTSIEVNYIYVHNGSSPLVDGNWHWHMVNFNLPGRIVPIVNLTHFPYDFTKFDSKESFSFYLFELYIVQLSIIKWSCTKREGIIFLERTRGSWSMLYVGYVEYLGVCEICLF